MARAFVAKPARLVRRDLGRGVKESLLRRINTWYAAIVTSRAESGRRGALAAARRLEGSTSSSELNLHNADGRICFTEFAYTPDAGSSFSFSPAGVEARSGRMLATANDPPST